MIRVNGKVFDAATVFATDGSMSMAFASKDKLDVIESYFPVDCVIEVIEQDEVVAKYYNKKVMSLRIENGDTRKATVVFTVSEIQQSAEAKLNDRADTSDGAIEELAGLVAEQMEVTGSLDDRATSLEETTAKFEERITKLERAAAVTTTDKDAATSETTANADKEASNNG